EMAAIDNTALKDVGVNARANGGPACSLWIPGVMLPRLSGSVARIRVVACLEVDVTDRSTFLKHEEPRLPRQIALRINLGKALLPTPARGDCSNSIRRCSGDEENRERQKS